MQKEKKDLSTPKDFSVTPFRLHRWISSTNSKVKTTANGKRQTQVENFSKEKISRKKTV